MAVISTKELFEAFFANKSEDVIKKTGAQIDRPEVYLYEKKIGKQLIDMDIDELFEMILTFRRGSVEKDGAAISLTSYTQISSYYRSLWNFYIDNYEIIRNPWNNPRMRGSKAYQYLTSHRPKFTKETLDEAISKVRVEYNDEKATFIECMLLLFYHGVAKPEEIIDITEDMIDFEKGEIDFGYKKIVLSEKCVDVLKKEHELRYSPGLRNDVCYESYCGSYIKFPVFANYVGSFQSRPKDKVKSIITRAISNDVGAKFDYNITYSIVYYLGLYEVLKSKFGEERTKHLVSSLKDTDAARELLAFVKEYGVPGNNITMIKKLLFPFI